MKTLIVVAAVILLAGCAALVRAAKSIPALAPPRPPIGIVAHIFTNADAAAIVAMGAKSVRLSWYGDIPTLATQLSIASHFGLSVIIVAQTPLTDQFAATVGLWPQVQVENEPADPVAYAGRFLSARKVYGTRLRLLPAGLSNNVNAATLRAALTAGLGSSGVLCLHAYGTPLVNAIYDRMQMAAAAGWTGAIYFTEIGTKKPAELLPALQAIGLNTPTWIYELWGTDGFTLTTDERATIAKFTGTTP